MSTPADQPRVDTVRLQNLSFAYRESAVLMAAVELGLFTRISQGVCTREALADALGMTGVNAERLLTACTVLGLVERTEDGFRNAPDVERFLVEGTKQYAGAWLQLTQMGRDQWGDLAGALTAQQPPRILGSYENFTVDDARALHAATYSIGMGAGRRFARQVDLSARHRILDLGGGSGCYCIAAAQQYPNITAVVFDLPPVAVVAREYIAQHELTDRIDAVGGDFTKDAFPAGADVAIMASNLPQYSPELIALVVSKAYAALTPGGEMHLIGETLNPNRDGPVGPALWGLAETFAGSTGVAHSETDVIGYLEAAGFERVAAHTFVSGTLTRVTGYKPA